MDNCFEENQLKWGRRPQVGAYSRPVIFDPKDRIIPPKIDTLPHSPVPTLSESVPEGASGYDKASLEEAQNKRPHGSYF